MPNGCVLYKIFLPRGNEWGNTDSLYSLWWRKGKILNVYCAVQQDSSYAHTSSWKYAGTYINRPYLLLDSTASAGLQSYWCGGFHRSHQQTPEVILQSLCWLWAGASVQAFQHSHECVQAFPCRDRVKHSDSSAQNKMIAETKENLTVSQVI